MKLKYNCNINYEAGLDEAGRGCLAGSVFAAAVILPNDFNVSGINDSKKLTHKRRAELAHLIEKNAISYVVAQTSSNLIDKVNILEATMITMHHCISNLTIKPELILVDGNFFKPFLNIPHETIIKGDEKIISIASASILAKYYRDIYMEKIHNEFPMYNWLQNKGYGTQDHRNAIKEYGYCKYHRKSFEPIKSML